jgi:endonuclease/exonuclease/phosphatase family metal-dependent hydrolase
MKIGRHLIGVIAFLVAGCGNLPTYGELVVVGNANHPQAGNRISVTTWNVGYGAMGADADFVADGGDNMRALNAREIALAVQDIAQKASAFGTQFLMFQELANSSFLTRNVPVRTVIEDHLDGYSKSYWEDLGVSVAPKPFQISHGMGIYGLNFIDSSSAYELPQEPKFFFLAVKRYYAAIVSEVPISGSDRKWVLMNIHLSAFDEGADVRREQIRALFDFAKSEYTKGNYVVMGGDWNMRISNNEFAHTTADKHLFWVYDFPPELLPDGWRFGVDESTPTVRTLHKPYVEGENYTAIIDGFAYSPNVRLQRVETIDLGFKNSDHHPVTAVFSVR